VARRTFGTIRQLPSGRWHARFRDRDGQHKNAPRTFATKAEAGRWLSQTQADIERGEFVDPHVGKVALAEYSALWISTRLVRGRPLSPRTIQLYRWQLRKHILPTLGKIELRHLEARSARVWFGCLSGPDGPGRPTAAKCYRLLRAIMQTAVEDGLIARNPCAIRGAGREEQPTQRPMITIAQLNALADAVGDRWRCLVELAAWCGLRFGELAALRKNRIDIQSGTVSVVESAAVLAGGVRYVGPPKSDAGRREVAIPPHILPTVINHLERFSEPGPDGLVFVGPRGGVLSSANFGADVWRPSCRLRRPQRLHLSRPERGFGHSCRQAGRNDQGTDEASRSCHG
jgi:integrase